MQHYYNVKYGLDINSSWGVSGITNDSGLTYNEGRIVTEYAIKKYIHAQIQAASGVSQLDDLTDVTITGAQQDQFLIFSGDTWVNAYRNLGDLYDVTLSGLSAGDLVAWNSGTTQWENIQTIGFENLSGLTYYYTKIESDDRFVNVIGDTMTGTLIISGAGYLQLTNETPVNEIVTTVDENSTNFQLPTALAVWNADLAAIESAVTFATSAATFLHLVDTINTYNENRVLFEHSSGVTDSANFTFDGQELALSNDSYAKIGVVQFKNTADGLLIGNKSGDTVGSNIVVSLSVDYPYDIDSMPLGTYNLIFGTDTINNSGFTGDYNILVGRWAGFNLEGGDYNTYIGYQSGGGNKEGVGNVGLGKETGVRDDGDYNVDLGWGAGNNFQGSTSDNSLINIGYFAGYQFGNPSGAAGNSQTISIGWEAGKWAHSNNSTFIGTSVGYSAFTNDTIYIDTQYRVLGDYLFHGDGANRAIYLNGTVAISSGVSVAVGEFINDFSDDEFLTDESHTALVTEYAIKQYVDAEVNIATSGTTFIGLTDVDLAAYQAGYIPFEHSSGMTHSSDLRIENGWLKVGYNTLIVGDLYVSGTTTTINTKDLTIYDNIITINSGETGGGVSLTYAGMRIDRGTENPYFIVYNEIYDFLTVGFSASEPSLPEGLRRVPEMYFDAVDPGEGTLLFYSGASKQYLWDDTFYYDNETNTFNVENANVDDLTVNNYFTLGGYSMSGITNNSGLSNSEYLFATTYAIKNYIDNLVYQMNSGLSDQFVDVIGDTMTGTLIITGGSYLQLTYGASINEISEDSGLTDASQYAVVTEEALSLQFDYVQDYLYLLHSGLTNVYTIEETDDKFVFVTGDTMTGDLVMNYASVIISGTGYLQLPFGTTINEISIDSGFTSVTDDMISTSLSIKNYIAERIERISFTSITSLTNIDIFPNTYADGAVWHYTVKSGVTNLRTGTILGAWTTSDVEWNEYSTGDIGNTSNAEFSVTNSGGDISLALTPSSGTWDVLLSRNWI